MRFDDLLLWGCALAIPLVMVLASALFWGGGPARINGWYGYRTPLSMRSGESWRFAHRYFARLWLPDGLALAALSAAAVQRMMRAADDGGRGVFLLALVSLQVAALLVPLRPSERALARNFDRFGCPCTPLGRRLSAARGALPRSVPDVAADPVQTAASAALARSDAAPEASAAPEAAASLQAAAPAPESPAALSALIKPTEKINMENKIKMLALDLDGTLTNSAKEITPHTKAALEAAMDAGVTVVLASGRPTVGVWPVARSLGLEARGGCILAYNGGKILDCRTGETLYQKQFPPEVIPDVCAFAAQQDAAVISYSRTGVVTERPDDEWVLREAAINHIPALRVDDLAAYLDYPVCKMLIALDPARMPAVEAAAHERFAGRIDVFRSCDFFLELVPLGVAKDQSLAALLACRGLARENLMAVGDGMNDLSMIRFAGLGVAMANADAAVRAGADVVTQADNDHDGVAEVVEKYILNK